MFAALGMVFEYFSQILFMTKLSFVAALCIASSAAFSQPLQANFYGGIADYQGDLIYKRFTNLNPAVGLGLTYKLSPHVNIRAAATYLKLKAEDQQLDKSKNTYSRNLSFITNVWEAQLAAEYNFLDLEERGFTPYVFGGVAAFHFNPYVKDSTNARVYLRTLTTEGQGLPQYPEKKLYSNNQFAIPFGAGFKLALSPQLELGVEFGLRKLFTDYLDDVSGTYADSTVLANARGPLATYYAYRADENVGAPGYPAEGKIRGNPKQKDWYYFPAFRISYNFGNKASSNKNKGSKLGCPTNIY